MKNIKDNLPSSFILVESVFKKLIGRNQKQYKLEETPIKEVHKTIMKAKPSKARGNDKLSMYILKEIPQFKAICVTHLFNCIIRKGVFSHAVKTSRVKQGNQLPQDQGNTIAILNTDLSSAYDTVVVQYC